MQETTIEDTRAMLHLADESAEANPSGPIFVLDLFVDFLVRDLPPKEAKKGREELQATREQFMEFSRREFAHLPAAEADKEKGFEMLLLGYFQEQFPEKWDVFALETIENLLSTSQASGFRGPR